MRAILVREELVPVHMDPWALFDIDRWTITDFERSINLRRSITRAVEQHIVALDDVDAVSVNLVMPEKALLKSLKSLLRHLLELPQGPVLILLPIEKKLKDLLNLFSMPLKVLSLTILLLLIIAELF